MNYCRPLESLNPSNLLNFQEYENRFNTLSKQEEFKTIIMLPKFTCNIIVFI